MSEAFGGPAATIEMNGPLPPFNATRRVEPCWTVTKDLAARTTRLKLSGICRHVVECSPFRLLTLGT